MNKETDSAVVAGRGALFIGFAKGYFMLSGFAQQVLLPRILNALEFGAFSVVNNSISIINNTVVQSTIQGISKFTAEDDARVDPVKRAGLTIQIIAGLLIAAALFVAAPWVAAAFKSPQYTTQWRLVALIPCLYAVYSVFVGSANGMRRFDAQAGFDVGFATIKTVLMVVGALLWQVSGTFVGFIVAAVLILIIAARTMSLPSPTAAPFSKARLLRFMAALVGYNILVNLALNYDHPLMSLILARVSKPEIAFELAARYQTLRGLALLPYQALLVITFVIFPLVSRSTFIDDREATRAYVTQTLRYALILATAMGVCLAARPAALLGIVYRAEYVVGAPALPILVIGECCLAILAVSCAILNASGRTLVAQLLMSVAVIVGVVAALIMVPSATPGPATLIATATATTLGMATGLVASVVYMRTRLGGSPPLATVVRVGLAIGAAVLVGRFLPAGGKLMGLVTTALVGIIYFAVLIAAGEFSAADRAKFARILRRR